MSVIGLKKVFRLGHFRTQTTTKTPSKVVPTTAKAKIKNKKSNQFRSVTSGSEVSVVGRNENTMTAQHRNSSSG